MSSFAPATAAGPPPGMRVRLSSNESLFGPSPAAIAAATAAAHEAHRYPDDQRLSLRQSIAAVEGVAVDSIAVGTGSMGLILDLIDHECRDEGAVLTFQHAYLMYRLGARRAGVEYREAPDSGPARVGRSGYQRDPDALLERLDDGVRLVVVDNPGNPSNAHLSADALRRLVAGIPAHVTVVIDEAYHQFAVGHDGYATVGELGLEHPRLLVTRTFSKAHALAGLRVGYLRGPSDLVAALDDWRVRFNLSSVSQAAATASLADTAHLRSVIDATVAGRRRMAEGLRQLGVPISDGLGNFVTVELGEDSGPVVEAYAARGIGVRALRPYGMTEQIRVTVGTPQETEDFLAASAEVLGKATTRT